MKKLICAPVFVAVALGYLSVACVLGLGGGGHDTKDNSYHFKDPYDYNTGSGWTPKNVSLNCSEDGCPRAVGTVLMATQDYSSWLWSPFYSRYNIARCTAFLTSKDEISTNGHCDELDSSESAFFMTVSTSGHPSEIRKIVKLQEKYYSGKDAFGYAKYAQDYSRMKLDRPISDVAPIKLSRDKYMPDPDANGHTSLEAYVVNSDPNNDLELKLDKLTCYLDPNSWKSKVPLGHSPDTFTFYGCSIMKGNSGSPLFAPTDTSTAYGLVQATTLVNTAQHNKVGFRKKVRSHLINSKIEIGSEDNNWIKTKMSHYGVGTSTYCLSPKVSCEHMSSERKSKYEDWAFYQQGYESMIGYVQRLYKENPGYKDNEKNPVQYVPVMVTTSYYGTKSMEFVPFPICISAKSTVVMPSERKFKGSFSQMNLPVPGRVRFEKMEDLVDRVIMSKSTGHSVKGEYRRSSGKLQATGFDLGFDKQRVEQYYGSGLELKDIPVCEKSALEMYIDLIERAKVHSSKKLARELKY